MNLDLLIKQYFELFSGQPRIQQSKSELLQVIEYLGDRKFSNMAEIGVNYGGSMWLYSNLFLKDGGKFSAIDHRIRPIVDEIAQYLRDKKSAEVEVINHRSTHTDLRDLDFVHIDADHAYESVKKDFFHYYPRVITGGVILMHDTLAEEWSGAVKFKEELEASNQYDIRTFRGIDGDQIYSPRGSHGVTGITLIQK